MEIKGMIKSLSNLTFHPLGEQVLLVDLEKEVALETNRRMQSFFIKPFWIPLPTPSSLFFIFLTF